MSDNSDFPNNDADSSNQSQGNSPGSALRGDRLSEPTSQTREFLGGKGFQLSTPAKIGVFIAVLVLASIGLFSGMRKSPIVPPSATNAVDADPDEVAKRTPVQDFILTDASGQTKKLSDYRGNVVILSFWASWCAPCLDELPTFGQLSKDYYARGLRVLPVNVEEGDEGKNFAVKFWAAQHFTAEHMPAFYDTNKALASQFQVEMLPANFVIDREGRLAFSSFGANEWTNPETIEYIEGLLQEKPSEKTN